MGHLVRELDWDKHPLGPPELWPECFRTALSICLNSRFEIILWWDAELRLLYNDAYAPTLGVKHPASFGEPGEVVWHEIWAVIHPMLQGVLDRTESTWSDNGRLFLQRSGYLEETYHTFLTAPSSQPTPAPAGCSARCLKRPSVCWPSGGCKPCVSWLRTQPPSALFTRPLRRRWLRWPSATRISPSR